MRAIVFAVTLASAPMLLQGLALHDAMAGPAESQPATFALDSTHTQVEFSVDRFGFNRVLGLFQNISGEITLDDQHPENSSVHAIIPIASLNTGNAERDGFLKGKFWLKGDTYPSMEFRSTTVRRTAAGEAEVSGTLSLAGVTAPVTLQVRLNQRGEDHFTKRQAVGFSATGKLSRSLFGIRTAPPIGDEVRFNIEALGIVSDGSGKKSPDGR